MKLNNVIDFFGKIIFSARLGLIPMYLGLYVGIIAYTWFVLRDVWGLFAHLNAWDESSILLAVITLIDMTMVGNLVTMTMIGGYSIFVREYNYENLPDKPRWMHDFNTTAQKAKMGMSLIAISSVYLLRDYIQSDHLPWDVLLKRLAIIAAFIAISISYGFIARAIPHDDDPTVS